MWLMAGALTAVLTACGGDQSAYSHFEHVPQTVWHSDRAVRFAPQWPDSSGTYSLSLTVRHTVDYPHGNLPLTVDLIGDDGRVKRYRVVVPITDRQGNWVGQGFGTLYQCRATMTSQLAPTQAHRVVVWPSAAGCDSLPGVCDVGIALVKNNF